MGWGEGKSSMVGCTFSLSAGGEGVGVGVVDVVSVGVADVDAVDSVLMAVVAGGVMEVAVEVWRR